MCITTRTASSLEVLKIYLVLHANILFHFWILNENFQHDFCFSISRKAYGKNKNILDGQQILCLFLTNNFKHASIL